MATATRGYRWARTKAKPGEWTIGDAAAVIGRSPWTVGRRLRRLVAQGIPGARLVVADFWAPGHPARFRRRAWLLSREMVGLLILGDVHTLWVANLGHQSYPAAFKQRAVRLRTRLRQQHSGFRRTA